MAPRIQRRPACGFRAGHREHWQKMFVALQSWVTEHGRLPKYSEGSIGRWLARQRENYKRTKLAAHRRASLESLRGWREDESNETRFDDKCKELKHFIDQQQRFPLRSAGADDSHESRLAEWLHRQNKLYAGLGGQLTKDRKDKLQEACSGLDAVPTLGAWNTPSWQDMFKELQIWSQQNSGMPLFVTEVLTTNHGWQCLGRWLYWQLHCLEKCVRLKGKQKLRLPTGFQHNLKQSGNRWLSATEQQALKGWLADRGFSATSVETLRKRMQALECMKAAAGSA
eukprot:TRINITY_DN7624_c0_g1_i1.p1 TRINITY_DN7624_c0_g1~~TRINITY_DN7624_c0_g1_i1.p1  ORF type:complete len:283 (-),score=28.04 TRINITY_DN7624_c0_g1_i1:376-1224(-)